jgi:uncharacterized protein YozE (UPF0346 family)
MLNHRSILVLVALAAAGCASGRSPRLAGVSSTTDPSSEQARAAVLELAAKLNDAVRSGDASSIREMMYVPRTDYDFSEIQEYLEAVAAGSFGQSRFAVLHAEVDGRYAAAIIQQASRDGVGSELTPVAMFEIEGRWRVLPYDLPKDHPDLGERSASAYGRLLERAGDWVRANKHTIDVSGQVPRKSGASVQSPGFARQ